MKFLLKIQTLFLIGLVLGIISCGKKDSIPEESLSTLSAEQQKVRLDQEGINFISRVEGLEKPDLMDPMDYFIEIAQNMDEDQFKLSMKVGHDFIQSSKQLSGNYVKSTVINDASSFKKMMEDNQGIYTYNKTRKIWTKSSATGKVEFLFSANETTTANNVSFVISNLSTIAVTNTVIYEDLTDLPKTLDITFKVDNVLKYGYSISNDYNSDNIPTKEMSTLTITPYKFVEEYSLNNNKAVSFKSTMSSNNSVFLSIGASSDGSFTNDLLISDNTEGEDIVNKVNAYVQIENLKVSGNLDFRSLATKIKVIDTKYEDQYNYYNDQYPKAYYEECVELYKTYGTLNMLFADKNEIFAKLVPYVTNEKDWYYDYSSSDYVYKEYTRSDVGLKIVFTDGSQLDDSYFDSGFSAFVEKLNSVIGKMNYDYDESIDEIEY